MQKIRETRQAKKFTQQALSLATGLHQASISRMENGKQNVKVSDLRRIATVLGVSITQLIEG